MPERSRKIQTGQTRCSFCQAYPGSIKGVPAPMHRLRLSPGAGASFACPECGNLVPASSIPLGKSPCGGCRSCSRTKDARVAKKVTVG